MSSYQGIDWPEGSVTTEIPKDWDIFPQISAVISAGYSLEIFHYYFPFPLSSVLSAVPRSKKGPWLYLEQV